MCNSFWISFTLVEFQPRAARSYQLILVWWDTFIGFLTAFAVHKESQIDELCINLSLGHVVKIDAVGTPIGPIGPIGSASSIGFLVLMFGMSLMPW